MRKQSLAILALMAAPAAAADADTVCATLYTYLAQSAHQNGASGSAFEAAALKAEMAHLARNPAEDRGRYSITVVDGAETIRDGLRQGTITNGAVLLTANRCNAHYFPTLASQDMAYPDDWWGNSAR
jgi:hypothetical protein